MLNEETLSHAGEPQDVAKPKKHKKDKVRSAWISFAGRIVAQMVGAIATVALGLAVLHNSMQPSVTRAVPPVPPRPAGEISVAVLPMENFSGEAGHDYLADGMTEILIANLAKVGGFRVVSRTSSMHFKGQRQPLRDIANQLGVNWIIEGSIVRVGERVRITAQLIDAGTDLHAWAESYDRPAADFLGVQEEVASAIASAVSAALPSTRPVRPL